MDEKLADYFSSLIDNVNSIASKSAELEDSIRFATDQTKEYKEFFAEEIRSTKDLLHDLKLFVEGLENLFGHLQNNSGSFVSEEEMNELKEKVERINFENLQLRKVFKKKVFKSNSILN